MGAIGRGVAVLRNEHQRIPSSPGVGLERHPDRAAYGGTIGRRGARFEHGAGVVERAAAPGYRPGAPIRNDRNLHLPVGEAELHVRPWCRHEVGGLVENRCIEIEGRHEYELVLEGDGALVAALDVESAARPAVQRVSDVAAAAGEIERAQPSAFRDQTTERPPQDRRAGAERRAGGVSRAPGGRRRTRRRSRAGAPPR